jgi:hypothetical protein
MGEMRSGYDDKDGARGKYLKRYSASNPNPEMPYQLVIKFSGPPPDHPVMRRIVALVQDVNRSANPSAQWGRTGQVLTEIMAAQICDGLLHRTTTTLEIPDHLYSPVTRPAGHTRRSRVPRRA